MIPRDSNIALLHPQLCKKWGAVGMMIFLWNFLKKKWNNVTFYTHSYDKDLFSGEVDFEVIVWNKIKIAYFIQKSQFIFIWNSPMQFVWAFSKLCFFSKWKIFWWYHHYPWYYDRGTNIFIFLKKVLERFSLKYIDEIISNSLYLQKAVMDIYKKKSKILYPVIDKVFLDYKNKKKNFQTCTIISYGRWVKWKNISLVFKTYDSLKSKFPKLRLIVWWVWDELDFLKQKYSSDNHIKILWLLDKSNIISNLARSSVFLFPSKVDSFWISAVEALSIWIPVVWFSWKWLDEIVQNNKNWCTVESEEDFIKQVDIILSNIDFCKYLSKNAKKSVEKFSIYGFEEQLSYIFDEKIRNI